MKKKVLMILNQHKYLKRVYMAKKHYRNQRNKQEENKSITINQIPISQDYISLKRKIKANISSRMTIKRI